MINVSAFIKNNILLTVCTGALIGFLGYRIVRWIISRCDNTEKVDQIGEQNFFNSPPDSPEPPIKHVSKAKIRPIKHVSLPEICPDKVTMGQGEYVVFHQLPDGEKKELARETYEQVYQIFTRYSPAILMNSGSDQAIAECSNRYELIKGEVKAIDPSLEIVFVPRTLYELIFIKKCIKEDLIHKKICPFLNRSEHKMGIKFFDGDQQKYDAHLSANATLQKERQCWHLCYFVDAGDHEHTGVKEVAYRLNQAITKTLSPAKEGMTHEEFSTHVEKKLEFLKAHYNNSPISSSTTPGPTTNFATESTRGYINPMGIRDEADAQIIRRALALDCSKIAQNSFLLYRGADFQKDSVSCLNEKDRPYRLSYGTSLFAGCLYDGGASAFHFMRSCVNAYAIAILFDQFNDSPFYIPPTNTVAQFFGDGEDFQGGTKEWKGFDVHMMRGVGGGAKSGQVGHLESNLSQEDLIAQFEHYMSEAIQLK